MISGETFTTLCGYRLHLVPNPIMTLLSSWVLLRTSTRLDFFTCYLVLFLNKWKRKIDSPHDNVCGYEHLHFARGKHASRSWTRAVTLITGSHHISSRSHYARALRRKILVRGMYVHRQITIYLENVDTHTTLENVVATSRIDSMAGPPALTNHVRNSTDVDSWQASRNRQMTRFGSKKKMRK